MLRIKIVRPRIIDRASISRCENHAALKERTLILRARLRAWCLRKTAERASSLLMSNEDISIQMCLVGAAASQFPRYWSLSVWAYSRGMSVQFFAPAEVGSGQDP